MFGATTALIYGAMSAINPTYRVFLIGLFVATMAFRMVSSAVYGITNTIARKHAVSGQMSSVISVCNGLPDLLSFIAGGMLSQSLEGESATAAARILFLCAAGLMIAIAVMGLLGPRWVFEEARSELSKDNILQDLNRIVRHWPIYPAMLIQVLWQFSPATGTVLQYHIVDHLHATDRQWGLWQGVFFGSFIPIYAAYAFLSRRFALRPLLWFGFTLGRPFVRCLTRNLRRYGVRWAQTDLIIRRQAANSGHSRCRNAFPKAAPSRAARAGLWHPTSPCISPAHRPLQLVV
jgi:MFS family permease